MNLTICISKYICNLNGNRKQLVIGFIQSANNEELDEIIDIINNIKQKTWAQNRQNKIQELLDLCNQKKMKIYIYKMYINLFFLLKQISKQIQQIALVCSINQDSFTSVFIVVLNLIRNTNIKGNINQPQLICL